MRTLSARILLGFAALTITFGVITATLVVNMSQVEDQVILIGKGYMPIALVSKDLQRNQEDLDGFLDELRDESVSEPRKLTLMRLRRERDRLVRKVRTVLEELERKIDVDPMQFTVTRPKIETIEHAIGAVGPLYEQILAAPPPPGDPDASAKAQQAAVDALVRVKYEEKKINTKAMELAGQLQRSVGRTADNLEKNEHTLRLRTIYSGITAVVLGLLVTVWVVITLRPLRRLREGARRIAAGDYGEPDLRGGARRGRRPRARVQLDGPRRRGARARAASARSGSPRSARWPR